MDYIDCEDHLEYLISIVRYCLKSESPQVIKCIRSASKIFNNFGKISIKEERLERSGLIILIFDILDRTQDKVTIINLIKAIGRFLSFGTQIIDYICNPVNFINIIKWGLENNFESTPDADFELEPIQNVKDEIFDFLNHLLWNFGNVDWVEEFLFGNQEVENYMIQIILCFLEHDWTPEKALNTFNLIDTIFTLGEDREERGQSNNYLKNMMGRGFEDCLNNIGDKFEWLNNDVCEFYTKYNLYQYSEPIQASDFMNN